MGENVYCMVNDDGIKWRCCQLRSPDFIVYKVKFSVRALDLGWISTSNR